MAFTARALPRTLSPKVLRPHALRLRQWQCRQLATAATATQYRDPGSFLPEAQQTPQSTSRASIRQAKPFSEFLTDNFDRQHDYLRISLTERCNLRCTYCMPEEGIQLSPNKDILTTAEIHYISALFVNQGVNKIRLTGGEPTVRKDILPLMRQIGSLRSNGLKELALTTNGISLHRKLEDMVAAGLTGVNISLDTLDPFQFQLLTRRQGFSAVMKSIERVKEMNKLGAKIKLKINCVMMRGLNDHQLLPFVEMTQNEDLEVRFIEYMPFGGNKWNKKKMMSYEDMLDAIRAKYPDIARLKDARNDTSKTWQVPGFAGRVGFITSMTHNFCGSCNRLRITSDGNLKVCLHGETEVSLRDLLRKDHGGEPMDEEAFEAIRKLELDRQSNPSLRFDGEEGWMSKEQQLLDVIGAAVKRKKAKHAGIGQLENMKNRPMILIGDRNQVKASYNPRSKPTQHSSFSSRSPWSQIPTHILGTPHSASLGQVRAYSSDSKDAAGLDFGFQSLGSLFPAPPSPGRYSRPKERRAEDAVSKESGVRAPSVEAQKGDQTAFPAETTETSLKENIPQTKQNPKEENAAKTSFSPNDVSAIPERTPVRRVHEREGSVSMGRRRERLPGKKSQASTKPRTTTPARSERKVLNPFPQTKKVVPSDEADTDTQPNAMAWGLSQEDQNTIDSISDSSAPLMKASNIQQVAKSSDNIPATPAVRRLTHVNSSGEAHMVDVGDKASTKRVAIAVAHVGLNKDAYDQIVDNSNKKGDVLGIARIAGIMAAKRTADIIPLCHPLVISKAEVDVHVVPQVKLNQKGKHYWSHTRQRGSLVAIQARVECVGPTGVEMEALMAVQGAALTVFDMCKAVDKTMTIHAAKVVYKAGGRSGLSVDQDWKRFVDKESFMESGELKDGADAVVRLPPDMAQA